MENYVIRDECKHCGRPLEEHCVFEPVKMPPKCVCKYKDWMIEDEDIPPVCNNYVEDEFGVCKNCEHLPECHGVNSNTDAKQSTDQEPKT